MTDVIPDNYCSLWNESIISSQHALHIEALVCQVLNQQTHWIQTPPFSPLHLLCLFLFCFSFHSSPCHLLLFILPFLFVSSLLLLPFLFFLLLATDHFNFLPVLLSPPFLLLFGSTLFPFSSCASFFSFFVGIFSLPPWNSLLLLYLLLLLLLSLSLWPGRELFTTPALIRGNVQTQLFWLEDTQWVQHFLFHYLHNKSTR